MISGLRSRRCAAVGHLRAKSRALRPGCAPKRRCGASTKRACGRRPRRQAACSFTVGMALPLVCRGRMHAARHVCFTIPFFGCDGVWSMRRGGIHAAREHCGHCPLPGRLLFVLPCRAGDFARRTDNFFIFYNVRRGQDPALQSEGNGQPTANLARPFTPAGRHVCLPYKHPVSRTQTQKRHHRANGHGPHACGPYEPTGNGRQMGKADVCHRPARPRTRAGFQNGSPDEPYRQERNGIVTQSLCLARNANRLGRPP